MANSDWTRGAAKWGAAILLAAASVGGMAWSLSGARVARVQSGVAKAAAPVEAREEVRGAKAPASPGPAQANLPGGKPESAATENPKAAADQAPSSSPPAAAGSHRVNLNSATQAELELLPGIGPAMAKRILEYRTEHGTFTSVEQLDNVRGIGSKTMAKLRPLVTVE